METHLLYSERIFWFEDSQDELPELHNVKVSEKDGTDIEEIYNEQETDIDEIHNEQEELIEQFRTGLWRVPAAV